MGVSTELLIARKKRRDKAEKLASAQRVKTEAAAETAEAKARAKAAEGGEEK